MIPYFGGNFVISPTISRFSLPFVYFSDVLSSQVCTISYRPALVEQSRTRAIKPFLLSPLFLRFIALHTKSYHIVSCRKGHTHVCVSNHTLAFGHFDSSIHQGKKEKKIMSMPTKARRKEVKEGVRAKEKREKRIN